MENISGGMLDEEEKEEEERWLEGLSGQNREEGQGVWCPRSACATLNRQLSVYPAGQSNRNMPAWY